MSTYLPKPLLQVIGLATLIVGTLDLSDAIIFYWLHGVPPIQIPQSIASGIFGIASFRMGFQSALLGVALHYLITLIVVTLYLLANRKVPLTRYSLFTGTLYGILVYCIMNYVVLPLSLHSPVTNFSLVPFLNAMAASIFLIGIPTALIANRYQSLKAENR
jgi:hypothetical protein